MKKFVALSILSLGLVAYGTDVIPNESAFPAAKPLINAKFSSLDSSNSTTSARYAAQVVSNAQYSTFIAEQVVTNATIATKLLGVTATYAVTNNGGSPIFNMYFTNGVLGKVVQQ